MNNLKIQIEKLKTNGATYAEIMQLVGMVYGIGNVGIVPLNSDYIGGGVHPEPTDDTDI